MALWTINQDQLKNILIKNWMTHDALWYGEVAAKFGMSEASPMNLRVCRKLGQIEFGRLMKMVEIPSPKNIEEYQELFELGEHVFFPDFVSAQISYPGNDSQIFDFLDCFAYKGMKKLGLLIYSEGSPFFFVWLFFGSLGTIGIPLAIVFKNKKQVLEAAGNSLVIYGTQGYPWSRVEIDKENLHALTLEHYEEHDRESVYTLNLFQEPGIRPHRIMLASFVHSKDKATLFEEIKEFLQNNGFGFQVKNEMTSWVET